MGRCVSATGFGCLPSFRYLNGPLLSFSWIGRDAPSGDRDTVLGLAKEITDKQKPCRHVSLVQGKVTSVFLALFKGTFTTYLGEQCKHHYSSSFCAILFILLTYPIIHG
jgi:hypothetical protein